MRVHLHTLCWNDRRMLDYFFRHYEPWVDRFYIFDDHSTDGTLEYLQARSDVVVEPLRRIDPDSWVLSAKHIYDTDWMRSIGEADWVVITNIDEHLHHPAMRRYLAVLKDRGVTVVPALGYQMITESFPPPESVLWRDHTMGAPWRNMSKVGIFRPDCIKAVDFAPGRHHVRLKGEVVFPERDEVLNLHYKYLGIAETHGRHATQAPRLGKVDRAQNWGHKYRWSFEELTADFAAVKAAAVDVSKIDHQQSHTERRWWRS